MLGPYLDSSHFIVLADHQALRWILNLTESTGQLA